MRTPVSAIPRPANVHYILPPQKRASVAYVSSIAIGGQPAGGGAEGIRTPDLRLAKAALSQLSYGPVWLSTGWANLDSNQGPQSYQDCALAD